ncbi:MAG: potassium transporter [Desulfobacteraceae bacterium]
MHAAQYLSKKNREARFVLVDEDGANLAQAQGPNRVLEQSDGVSYLERHLKTDQRPDWIIPALPIHLAAEWCLVRHSPKRFQPAPLPTEIKTVLPNPMEGYSGDIYVSHADFRCPDDCVEPRHICTATQKPRKRNMFDLLSGITYPGLQSLVIRTLQLGPGIGGYRPAMLFELLEQVEQAENNLLLSTACRCHGVVTAWNLRFDRMGKIPPQYH